MESQKQQQFSIIAVNILKECDSQLKKLLQPGYYSFNEWATIEKGGLTLGQDKDIEKCFFGKNITIQAIVGKNGSGKSSLLEIMYRMINNLGYMLVRKQRRRAAETLYFIDGLHAELYFVVGGSLGTLFCKGNTVAYALDDKKYFFGDYNPVFNDFEDCNNAKNERIVDIAKNFFYTIVTNYSMQSFIASDYSIESSKRYESDGKYGISSSAIWINSLFHKNDGYITPIVLNPYRDDGVIDLKKEYQLTNYRLSAILIESKNNKKQFIDDYQLNSIEYKYNPYNVFLKFEEGRKKNAKISDFIKNFITLNDNTFSSIILNEFGYKTTPILSDAQIIAYIYIVYKTLSIASKYPSFNDYEQLGVINEYKKEASEEEKIQLISLVRNVKKDRSHITVKIRQTQNFLKSNLSNLLNNQGDFDFTYEKYVNSLKLTQSLKGLESIMEHIPPPFFDFDIKLDKTKGLKKTSNEPILFKRMSSGERQFIYTISTYIYHIKNLLSIQQTNRVKYRNINLILDEVEICFHPEYQRLFIDKLVRAIQRLYLNTHCSFNIIIATHSPFILSDIPKTNILYLDNGRSISKEEFDNPFGANISDILHQSFFLQNGFIGEFARNKISSLVDFLTTDKKSAWTYETAKHVVNSIGEPIIKRELQLLFDEKFEVKKEVEAEILRLEKKIETLKSQK